MNFLIDYGPWLLLGAVAIALGARYGFTWRLAVALYRRDVELRHSVFQGARIRRNWADLAQHLKLVLVDRTALEHGTGLAGTKAPKPKIIVPKMRVRPDSFGLVIDVKTIPGVGLPEFQKAKGHLSDEWRCVRVAVSQAKPGVVRIRAVRIDPLATPTQYIPDLAAILVPAHLRSIPIGLDEYAEEVELRLENVAGVGIFGLPGYGKTSLVNNIITRLAPSPAVQFVLLDGKTEDPTQGDYGDVQDRFAVMVGDDVEQANELLAKLCQFRQQRSSSIRTVLGVKNMWHVGPSVDWPLICVFIDEAHTYFERVADGGDKELKRRNALAAQNAAYVQDLVKKARSVGMIVFLLTQKGTGDAIPTSIRDVCSVSICFACRTTEAAIAALGDDIKNYPEANPIGFQDPMYVGVASMVVTGKPGYTRVRMPYVPDDLSGHVANMFGELVPARGELPAALPAGVATGPMTPVLVLEEETEDE